MTDLEKWQKLSEWVTKYDITITLFVDARGRNVISFSIDRITRVSGETLGKCIETVAKWMEEKGR